MPDKDGSVYSFIDKELLNINTSIKQICRLDRTARRQSRDPGIGLSGRPQAAGLLSLAALRYAASHRDCVGSVKGVRLKRRKRQNTFLALRSTFQRVEGALDLLQVCTLMAGQPVRVGDQRLPERPSRADEYIRSCPVVGG